MHRRKFFTAAGGLGLAATGCAKQPSNSQAATSQKGDDARSNDGVVIHPWESEMMRGFPPRPENQVTRENQEESLGKLRWAMQHCRELFPTQRVSRGDNPIVAL